MINKKQEIIEELHKKKTIPNSQGNIGFNAGIDTAIEIIYPLEEAVKEQKKPTMVEKLNHIDQLVKRGIDPTKAFEKVYE